MKQLSLAWQQWVAVAAVAVLLLGVLYWALRRRPTPDEIERKRRAHINQIGRIAEGHVVEIFEAPADPANSSRGVFSRKKRDSSPANGSRKLVHYTYSVSGVSYSTAQDVTDLEARSALRLLVAGQHASIKYDPANPGNSILIADDWSGVR